MAASRSRRPLRGCIAGVMVLACVLAFTRVVDAQCFGGSVIAQRDGRPTLLVDGRPFFFYGAAFFYERIPATRWRASMLALRAMGFNTLDLYVPWNWHETADGAFDFDGHTNARRNLRGVLALARELHFKLIVRPGPVIRNEWRNGGYPAWLLSRAEYRMPLHDVLEGRYPATATLQNANSDDAAVQWMHNATHLFYARRWLETVLREFVPVADSVVAIALDDDQGAYIDNQTWPAPHLRAYLQTLETIVRGVVGPRLPVFINTYEMKVTASSPVWAMGNWYQSDTYSIGEHDRASLEFSTGLLQTQTRYPVAISEFQAGWLAGPEDPRPRPADPTNTTLALHTLLGLGARGVVDFPPQDTVNPAGWEAPFANADYAWDAALDVDLKPSPRYAPTARFGELVRSYGTELAGAQRFADGAIAYLTSAYDASRLTQADVFEVVARTQQAQSACRARHLTCDLIDLRFIGDGALGRYAFVVVPAAAVGGPWESGARARLARYRATGGHVVAQPPDVVSPHAGGIPNATVLLAHDGAAFLDIVNYDPVPRRVAATSIRLPSGRLWKIAPLTVAARDARLLRRRPADDAQRDASELRSPGVAAATPGIVRPSATPGIVRPSATPGSVPPSATPGSVPPAPAPAVPRPCETAFARPPSRAGPLRPVRLIEDDRAEDGYPRITLQNDRIALTFVPNAGARAFALSAATDGCSFANAFTSVGALRDDVLLQPPLSATDRIGKYTRSFPAGMFNRDYRIEAHASSPDAASVTVAYDAPDVVPSGARFERTLTVGAADSAITVNERATFAGGPRAAAQRAVRYDSFDTRGAATLDERSAGAVGFFFPVGGYVSIAAWNPAQVESAQLIAERTSTVLHLTFAAGPSRTRYALEPARDIDEARAMLLRERTALATMR